MLEELNAVFLLVLRHLHAPAYDLALRAVVRAWLPLDGGACWHRGAAEVGGDDHAADVVADVPPTGLREFLKDKRGQRGEAELSDGTGGGL